MPSEESPHRRHILLSNQGTNSDFVPLGWPTAKYRLATRNREEHGERIKQQLEQVQTQQENLRYQRGLQGIHEEYGSYIEVEGERGFDLKVDSLGDIPSGIEVVNVKVEDEVTKALVYVPEGKIVVFFRKVDSYLTKQSAKGIFRNKTLVESISKVRAAALKSFWTDSEIVSFDEIPNDSIRWWEVWLRAGENDDDLERILETFKEVAQGQNIQILGRINFPERTVVLANASKIQLSSSIMLLDCLAELRVPRETAQKFMSLDISEQKGLIDNFLSRVIPPTVQAPAVCILDTGVNSGHPMLSLALSSTDMHSYKPDWGVSDDDGHGTEVAGVALYGDLVESLKSMSPISLQHRLESVKIFKEKDPHEACLYGEVTKESITSAERGAPNRSRTVCLTVASEETRLKGNPTSWSAALDQLATGVGEQEPHYRLIAVAAGNIRDENKIRDYPNSNLNEGIHDPGQAWNVLTVGAYTEKDSVDPVVWPDWIPIAPKGALAPSSTTTFQGWGTKWPTKPDIVFEGGNMAIEPTSKNVGSIDSLQLLTTHYKPTERLFSVIGETSAATALAGRFAATIQANYPTLWPETIRGLLIHSASWNSSMRSDKELSNLTKDEVQKILKVYGYGVPDLDMALWSANNVLTLIAQDSLVPFKEKDGEIKSNQINLHKLPWPTDILQDQLGMVSVELRITLSYFIEPNPTHREDYQKYDYASHSLRFELMRAYEAPDQFAKRINRAARIEDEEFVDNTDPLHWTVGKQNRSHGSIHSDIWRGSGVDLAKMDSIAVFPVTGWWKMRKRLGKWNSRARYSLIVTIRTPEESIDIYTPVLNLVETLTPIQT